MWAVRRESLDRRVTKASQNEMSESLQCAAEAAWGVPPNLVKAPPSSTKPLPAVLNLWVVTHLANLSPKIHYNW